MRLNQRRRFTGAAVLALLALSAGTVFGQAAEPLRGRPGPGSGLATAALSALNNQLGQLERLINSAEAAKSISEHETRGKEISESLEKYAKAMLEATNNALMDAEKSAKSNGKEGSFDSIHPIEELNQKHERQFKQMEDKSKKILEKIEKLESDPKTDPKKTGSVFNPSSNVASLTWLTVKDAVESVIPSANAAILIPTIAPCSNLNPNSNPPPTAAQYKACADAIALAHSQRLTAQTTFTSCWNAAHRHRKFPDGHIHVIWTMHLACTATLVAKLA